MSLVQALCTYALLDGAFDFQVTEIVGLESNPLLQKKKKTIIPLCKNVEQYKILPSDDKKTVNKKHGKLIMLILS